VALGLIADVMDARDFETSFLINKGLAQISNPFFKTMCGRSNKLGPYPTPVAVAWYAAPYVNATIRVGDAKEKLILFESMLDFKGYQEVPSTKRGCKGQMEALVEQACRNCVNIKKRQTDARDASLNVIKQKIKNENLLDNQILLVSLAKEDNINKNVLGLIANQVMSEYQKPVMLLNENAEENLWEGSCRGAGIPDFRQFLLDSKLVEYGQGHANAFGAGIVTEKIPQLISYANNKLAGFDFSPCYKVDFIYQNSNFSAQDILAIAGHEFTWRTNVEEPYIAIENIKITDKNLQLMGRDKNPTLKITLDNGVCLIKFKSSEEEFNNLLSSNLGCVIINVVGKCKINNWNGNITPQIFIEEYEIIKNTPYYF
jgi:single-stranded-DNA-specific exonuclease